MVLLLSHARPFQVNYFRQKKEGAFRSFNKILDR